MRYHERGGQKLRADISEQVQKKPGQLTLTRISTRARLQGLELMPTTRLPEVHLVRIARTKVVKLPFVGHANPGSHFFEPFSVGENGSTHSISSNG